MKQSHRRKADLPARDTPEQSEASLQSAKKPDKIGKSTFGAEASTEHKKAGSGYKQFFISPKGLQAVRSDEQEEQ